MKSFALFDGQRRVLVCELNEMAGHKRFSRHGPQRLENCGIPNSSASNMTVQHALALFFCIHASHPGRVYDHLRLAATLSIEEPR